MIYLNSMLLTINCNYKKHQIKLLINKKSKNLNLEFNFKIIFN